MGRWGEGERGRGETRKRENGKTGKREGKEISDCEMGDGRRDRARGGHRAKSKGRRGPYAPCPMLFALRPCRPSSMVRGLLLNLNLNLSL